MGRVHEIDSGYYDPPDEETIPLDGYYDTSEEKTMPVGQNTRDLGRKIVDEAIRLEKENILLRELVRQAYNEGFSEGMREHTSSRGGKPWRESKAYLAVNPSAH